MIYILTVNFNCDVVITIAKYLCRYDRNFVFVATNDAYYYFNLLVNKTI